MADIKRVIIDAGHGGEEPGAMYDGRREKDDALRLALAIGQILEKNGVDVVYTRTTDVFDTPLEKAQIANNSGADYFVSIHRNAMPVPGTGSGAMVLVYEDAGVPAMLAENIQRNLVQTGFNDLGIQERPGLIVLRRTQDLSIIRRTTNFLMKILTPLPRQSRTGSWRPSGSRSSSVRNIIRSR